MKTDRMKVLVIGATGKQGGHVARLLLKKDHRVLAFTRKTDSFPARDLAELGADLVKGDLNDRQSVDRAVEGVDAVFLMSTPFDGGVDAEVKQGCMVADVAKAKGKYFVFTSVASADKSTGIPYFDSKWKIEQHIRKIGADAAIIAPVYFMENVITYGKDQLMEGMYASPLPLNRRLAQIALDDIAGFAVLALENKSRFVGKRFDLASDNLTGADAATILSDVLGKPIQYFRIPMDEIRKMSEDMVKMFTWFDRVGYEVDIETLRKDYPEVKWHSYERWAKERNWDAILSERGVEELALR